MDENSLFIKLLFILSSVAQQVNFSAISSQGDLVKFLSMDSLTGSSDQTLAAIVFKEAKRFVENKIPDGMVFFSWW